MKLVIVTCLATALAGPGEAVLQLCKHQSGATHLFSDDFCDGEGSSVHEHESHHHDYHDDHDHTEKHSHHTAAGEHHEPCSHETLFIEPELSTSESRIALNTDLVSAVLIIDDWRIVKEFPAPLYLVSEPRVRGPPGLDDPLIQFTSCIRLTA